MHVEFLVEEASAEAALNALLPGLFGEDHTYAIRTFSGKSDLLEKLPDRLRAYAKFLGEEGCIVVLIDKDRSDCHALKQKLEEAALAAGLGTRTRPLLDGSFRVVNRICIEELEAWFFGDMSALRSVYPKLPATLA